MREVDFYSSPRSGDFNSEKSAIFFFFYEEWGSFEVRGSLGVGHSLSGVLERFACKSQNADIGLR